MATVQPHPRPYELMTVLVPELGDEDLDAQIDRINGQITAAGGSISETLRESPWGRRRLAYAIRHNGQDYRDGYYVVTHFTLPPARTTELERDLKLNVQVIRYLLVHDDPKVGERARDPELTVEHSDEAQAVQSADAAATTAAVLTDPDAVTSDAPGSAEEASPAPESDGVEPVTASTDTTLADAAPIESQATPPPVNASNPADMTTDAPEPVESTTTAEEPVSDEEREG